jgi:trimethylamine:corrinoid methyltransferase-like protein
VAQAEISCGVSAGGYEAAIRGTNRRGDEQGSRCGEGSLVARARLSYLTAEGRDSIHEQTVRVFEEIGIDHNTPSAIDLLAQAAASVDRFAHLEQCEGRLLVEEAASRAEDILATHVVASLADDIQDESDAVIARLARSVGAAESRVRWRNAS